MSDKAKAAALTLIERIEAGLQNNPDRAHKAFVAALTAMLEMLEEELQS